MADAPEEQDLTVASLATEGAVVYLGQLGSLLLREVGTVTFFADVDGSIRVANPLYVYLDPKVRDDQKSISYRLLRPVVSDGQPRYAVVHNGRLWEVEFDEEAVAQPSMEPPKDDEQQ